MAEADDIASVREMLGESIPTDGEASDTLFTDAQVLKWVSDSTSLEGAAYRGWIAKAAALSSLVNVADGASSRALSDLFIHAQAMVKMYSGLAEGPTSGRARVGKIVRSS